MYGTVILGSRRYRGRKKNTENLYFCQIRYVELRNRKQGLSTLIRNISPSLQLKLCR
jgi:hypothetical protein